MIIGLSYSNIYFFFDTNSGDISYCKYCACEIQCRLICADFSRCLSQQQLALPHTLTLPQHFARLSNLLNFQLYKSHNEISREKNIGLIHWCNLKFCQRIFRENDKSLYMNHGRSWKQELTPNWTVLGRWLEKIVTQSVRRCHTANFCNVIFAPILNIRVLLV